MSKPSYIERGGEQVFAQPFIAEDVQFFGFAVKADEQHLTALCNRFLNEPCGSSDFVPAVSHVLFVFNRLGKMYAKNPPGRNRGWYSEQEGAVWMLVLDKNRKNLFWFHPYMLVDNAFAYAMGREIYGFPKEMGWFDIPDGPDAPASMHVETIATKFLTPDCQAKRGLLFSAQRTSEEAIPHREHTSLKELVTDVAEVLGIGADFLDHLQLGKNLFEDLIQTRMPMAFLKQIRDSVDPSCACFQCVQECMAQMTRFHNARLYFHRYAIAIEDYASHPIRDDLGLPPGDQAVDVAFWARFDFEIGTCTELHKAS